MMSQTHAHTSHEYHQLRHSGNEDEATDDAVGDESHQIQDLEYDNGEIYDDGIEQNTTTQSNSLYISHFISTWNSRGFEFGAVLFLANIYPDTLMPMSIYALVRAGAAIIFSPWVGRHIDTAERLAVVRLSIIGQRIAVVLSCLGFLLLLSKQHSGVSIFDHISFGGLVVLACVEKICSVMNTVAVERDWVVVIAGRKECALQEMNSRMRRIDLFCKLLSPLAIALLDGISSNLAVVVTLCVNAATVGIEYLLIARVYCRTPALSRHRENSFSLDDDDGRLVVVDPGMEQHPTTPTSSKPKVTGSLLVDLRTYLQSPVVLPSLSLSMLYLTVLSFSGQMTTYLLAIQTPRLTSTSVGLLRTISTIFELLSTFLAPQLIDSIGPVRAGIWCLSWQALCLTSGVGMLITSSSTSVPKFFVREDFLGSNSTKAGVIALVVCVILSRVGLWSFDLVAQLLIQGSIDSQHRGSFSSVEASLQNFFELCTFASTIIWSKPEQFKYPAMISVIAVWVAGACYAKFVRDRRGHLVHLPPCLGFAWLPKHKVLQNSADVADPEAAEGRRDNGSGNVFVVEPI